MANQCQKCRRTEAGTRKRINKQPAWPAAAVKKQQRGMGPAQGGGSQEQDTTNALKTQ